MTGEVFIFKISISLKNLYSYGGNNFHTVHIEHHVLFSKSSKELYILEEFSDR